jgi:hypothetical protein
MQLILPVGTELASSARGNHPLYPSAVADVPEIFHIIRNRHDLSRTFVPCNTVRGVEHGYAHRAPFVEDEGLVRSAEAGPVDLDEDLPRAW